VALVVQVVVALTQHKQELITLAEQAFQVKVMQAEQT
jgi:hypothetical protein